MPPIYFNCSTASLSVLSPPSTSCLATSTTTSMSTEAIIGLLQLIIMVVFNFGGPCTNLYLSWHRRYADAESACHLKYMGTLADGTKNSMFPVLPSAASPSRPQRLQQLATMLQSKRTRRNTTRKIRRSMRASPRGMPYVRLKRQSRSRW